MIELINSEGDEKPRWNDLSEEEREAPMEQSIKKGRDILMEINDKRRLNPLDSVKEMTNQYVSGTVDGSSLRISLNDRG